MTWAKACTSSVSTICCAMIAASIKCLRWRCWVCLRVWVDKHCSGLSWPSDKKTHLCWECGISQTRDKNANRQESKWYIFILEGHCGDMSLFMWFLCWRGWVDKLIEWMCLCKWIYCRDYLCLVCMFVYTLHIWSKMREFVCTCALHLCRLQLHWGY